MPPSVAVVGAGVIGLATGWRLAERGASVHVFDAGPIPGGRPHAASWASAGLIAPGFDHAAPPSTVARAAFDALTRRAARGWPAFAAQVARASGVDIGFRVEGTLTVAPTDDEAARSRASTHLPNEGRWLDAAGLAAAEPALAGAVGAWWSGDDVQVDSRRLVGALAEACRRAGVRLCPNTPTALDLSGARPRLLGTPAGGAPTAAAYDAVLVAAGAWAGVVAGWPPGLAPPVRPVAGQMLALQMPAGAPLLRHVVITPDVYLAPRADGRLLVGATVEERGFDAPLTAGGVRALLDGVCRALPAAAALPVAELWSGLRPGSPDDMPVLGWVADRVAVASGHYRNGILLAPVTAEAMAALLLGEPGAAWAAEFGPERFRC